MVKLTIEQLEDMTFEGGIDIGDEQEIRRKRAIKSFLWGATTIALAWAAVR